MKVYGWVLEEFLGKLINLMWDHCSVFKNWKTSFFIQKKTYLYWQGYGKYHIKLNIKILEKF